MVDITKINLSATTTEQDITFMYYYLKPVFFKVLGYDEELYNDFILKLIKVKEIETTNLFNFIYTIAKNMNSIKNRKKKKVLNLISLEEVPHNFYEYEIENSNTYDSEEKLKIVYQHLSKTEISFINKYHSIIERKPEGIRPTRTQRNTYCLIKKKLRKLNLKHKKD